MISVERLCKNFGSKEVVSELSFQAKPGEVLGFLGPNGAGKSTTMKMLTGFLQPTSGKATINGADTVRDTLACQRMIGYLPESAASYGEMLVCEFLSFVAEVRGLKKPARRDALERVLEQCFLADVWNQPIETLSKGYRQRVGFAQALIHNPSVLILDEPTDGLDPNQKHEVRKLIRSMSAEKTIILSTHILEEVEQLCKRVVIISQGKLILNEPLTELMQKSAGKTLEDIFRDSTRTLE